MLQISALHSKIYVILFCTFSMLVILSNILSAKLIYFSFFNEVNLPAGIIIYPLTFLISDLITEVYGYQKAKFMIYTTFGMAILSFLMIQIALLLPSQSIDNQIAFEKVLGLNGLIILASLTAYFFAQFLDIRIYTQLKKWTGPRLLWLRNNLSLLISQLIDTVIVNLIHLYWGLELNLDLVLQTIVFIYCYKAILSLLSTPLFYLGVYLLKTPPIQISVNQT